MADIVSKETRSKMMSGIRGKDTKPELLIRKGLHRAGFRFSLHKKGLPGRPDLVFTKHNAVIFVHGCFWHQHSCHLFKMPSTRVEFWTAKFTRNVEVDARNIAKLKDMGWRIGIVWECAIKGQSTATIGEIVESCANWLVSGIPYLELKHSDETRLPITVF